MITEVHIQNFKSIQDLKLKLGRVTVLIGENGCGKSNILEAIAFASAAANNKLDNEFLASRGIRMTDPQFMRAAFRDDTSKSQIEVAVADQKNKYDFTFVHHQDSASWMWDERAAANESQKMHETVRILDTTLANTPGADITPLLKQIQAIIKRLDVVSLQSERLQHFLIYSPENRSLRTFEREGQILPLGINGEGLFKLLKTLYERSDQESISELKEGLSLIDWFEDFRVSPGLSSLEATIQVKDRHLSDVFNYFDQRSSNEGFLFLLFYFSLFISRETPRFFAVDNIDASLNPKLCRELTRRLAALAQKHDKQVILTTHNPAVLDGLDLNDDEQRLLVVYRNSKGYTKARRVTAPEPISGEPPIRLSEAFLRGLIGGLPQNF